MVLNRKSAKKTSKVSLIIALAMLSTIFAVLDSHGYQVEHVAQNGMQMCKLSAVELFFSLIW